MFCDKHWPALWGHLQVCVRHVVTGVVYEQRSATDVNTAMATCVLRSLVIAHEVDMRSIIALQFIGV